MNRSVYYFIILILFPILSFTQESKVDVDSLYEQARRFYKEKEYEKALVLTNEVLKINADYTEIRILQIRLEQELNQLVDSSNDIIYLIKESEVIKSPVFKQLSLYDNEIDLNNFLNIISNYFKNDIDFSLTKAEALLTLKNKNSAKNELLNLKSKFLNGSQNYRLQELKKQISSNQIGVNYEIVSFLEDYPISKSWNNVSVDYKHLFGKHAVIGRALYNHRFNDEGVLYEIEAYPIISNNIYFYLSLSASNASFFQSFGGSLSIYYSLGNIVEIEGGFRYLEFDIDSFFTPVIGATKYIGRFYVNGRAFIGPKKESELIQNYQLNIRYYLKNPEDYLFLRLGTGISPDDRSRFTQVAANPNLVAKYVNLGINKWIGDYCFILSTGYLNEDLPNNSSGNQFVGTIGLKYRF